MISELLPKVQDLQSSLSKANSTPAIIDFLRSATLRRVLPQTPSPPSRKFLVSSTPQNKKFRCSLYRHQWSDSSIVWLTSLIWGEIFVRGMAPLGIWNSTNVRLFYVKHTQAQTRQITDAVSSVVGGLGGLLGRGSSESLSTRPRSTR